MSELTCATIPYTNNVSFSKDIHALQDASASAPLYELHQVIQQYQAQPELLKLILTSKVEEDKRRAEEAKLRAKELDYYMKHDSPAPALLPTMHQSKMPIPPRNKTDRSAPYPLSSPSSTTTHPPSENHDSSFDDHDHQQRRHSAATAMLAMGSSFSPLSPPSPLSDQATNTSDEDVDQSAYPSPLTDHYDDQEEEPPRRRRREMYAITKIVETRDFPYLDQYFWRNNGNTTQKKTGCRSIYYKCSNSNKGCKVNKTVTAKQNGEYLIKYRGTHLSECGMVERICDL
ncbi:hypothetical protein [Absidia glauca]|uniref:WRKY domain-containing protein n=1 Tax=Absidia glauca TaxID=4829 RepID=A0A163LP86_ABSGL|nr:hypothetical protein [Absidia glauca]